MINILQRPYKLNWSGNTVWYSLYSDVAKADPAVTFGVRVLFKRNDANDFSVISAMTCTPVAGLVKLNIQDIVHCWLEWLVPKIYDDSTPIPCKTQSGEFYIEYRELMLPTDDVAWISTEIDFIRVVFKGGIHQFKFQANNFWANYYPIKLPFLTWQNRGRLTSENERMYLLWVRDKDSSLDNFKYRIITYYTDETTAQKTVDIPAEACDLFYLPTGATQLSLADPAKSIWYWTVQVFDYTNPDAPGPLSEQFVYRAGKRNDYNGTTLHYRNSLGGLDSLRVRGTIDTNLDYVVNDSSRVMESDYFLDDDLPALESNEGAKELPTYKGDIGHLSKDEQDRLRDAFLQRQCYQLINRKWWPVKLLNKSLRLTGTKDKRFTFPIEWQYGDGGSYFYTPNSVQLGNGEDLSNVCDGLITDLEPEYAWDVANTTCTVTWELNISSAAGSVIGKFQYKIAHFTGWIDYPYPYDTPLETTHAVAQQVIIQFRTICAPDIPGQVKTVVFNSTNPSVDPPEGALSRLVNNTAVPIIARIYANSVLKKTLATTAFGGANFNFVDYPAGTEIKVLLPLITPASATLESDGNIYNGVVSIGKVIFSNVQITSGMIITLT